MEKILIILGASIVGIMFLAMIVIGAMEVCCGMHKFVKETFGAPKSWN